MANEKTEEKDELYLADTVAEDAVSATTNETEEPLALAEDKPKRHVRELIEQRGENRKVFRLDDGTQQAVFYPAAVHVFNEETHIFDEVDNTILEEDDGRHYHNRRGGFEARFSREEENDELFSMKRGMYGITVSVKKNQKHRNKGVIPTLRKRESAQQLNSEVLVFKDVELGTDMEYTVTEHGVKEDIVVKEKAAVYRYPFTLHCVNVTPQYDETAGRIGFVSNENGKEVFHIPAPFMKDADGQQSTGVYYELKDTASGDVQLTVVADSDWINAEERAFPVTIDPQINVTSDSDITMYSWRNGVMTNNTLHTIGYEDACCNVNRAYMHFSLPELPRNPRIKKVELLLTQHSGACSSPTLPEFGLYLTEGALTVGNCTPTVTGSLIDFARMCNSAASDTEKVTYSFDITKLFDQYNDYGYAPEGLVLKLVDETTADANTVKLYGAGSGAYAPKINVHYETSYGINTAYRTHTHELGRFGQGSIDLQCGNLMFESEDFAWPGNRMPVTIKHLYNSALYAYQYTANSDIKLSTANFSAMKLGYGYKINVMQSMMYDSTTDTYTFTDDDGTEICFVLSDKTTECDSNSQCYQLYEDSNGNEMYYDDCQRALTYEDTRYFFDYSGKLIKVVKGNNEMNIHYTSDRITSVTDGSGRDFCFTYNADGNLTSISAPDHSAENRNVITYGYTDSLLTKISYPDGSSAEIQYTSQMPSAVILKDSNEKPLYKVQYTFKKQRVASVSKYGVENNEFVLGESSYYEYSAASNRTIVSTTKPKDETLGELKDTVINTVYTFNDDGECIGEYAYNSDDINSKYVSGENVIASSGHINNIDNILFNHNFVGLNNWSSEPSNCETVHISNYAYEPYAKFGNKVLRMQTNVQNCTDNGVYQDTVILEAGEYTFSAYIRILSTFYGVRNAGAYIRVTTVNGEILAESEHISKYNTEYIRLVTPFTLDRAQSVHVHLMLDGRGAAYYDAVQLEKNSYANAYNMLVNSNFERDSIGWKSDALIEISGDEHFNMTHSLKLTGSLNSKNMVTQQVPVKANKGTRETFILSGWAKGKSLPYTDRENCEPNEFSLSAVIKYTDGTEETHTASFSPCTDEWQPASVLFAKSKYKAVSGVTVSCNYNYNTEMAYFDNIQLIRNSIETNLSEKDFASDTVEEEIVATEETDKFEEVKDAYGNMITETSFIDGEFGTIYRSFEYSSCSNGYNNSGNDLVGETDSRGNRTIYIVDEDTSRKEEIINRLGDKTDYEYDVNGRTAKVTNKSSDDTVLSSVSYDYDEFDNLKEITRGDNMQYSLVYNGFHNLAEIRIKEKNEGLLSYTYKKGNGRLKEMSFANGNVMKASYNGDGQLISEKWYSCATDTEPMAYYKYVYDSAGNIVRSIDLSGRKEYNYTYESGRIIRSAEYNITLDEILNVISKNVVAAIDYVYNEKGMLSKKTISADGSEIVYYTEYPENAKPVTKVKVNGRSVESHSKTDSFGRKVFDELRLGTGFVSRQFSYHAGKVTNEHKQNGKLKSSPTTSLVSQIVLSNGTTLSYTYDAEEHITSVTETYEVDDVPVVKVTSYTYDALGQLLTETSNGITTKFEYDNYGNIIVKGVADENEDIVDETKAQYTYDEVWKDKLTSFRGQEIIYDAQGNPTEYLGHNLTWEKGRQLKSFDGNTYTYNANGIRTSKTVDGIRHDYLLDGSKILREAWGDNTVIPLYDNSDFVCGVAYNSSTYFFLKNLQGDVIAITNGDGDTVAKYSYDAWGKCTVEFDSTDYIADINPFRYRGYYFDKETELYYLNSRYYDANTGRFINADSPEYVSIQGGNLFSYCGNCPTKNADYFGFCYVPTYPETYIPSYSSPSYSYGEKKKEDGIVELFIKVILGIVGLVGIFITSIVIEIRAFLKKNPWIQEVVSWILIALLFIAIFFSAPWLTIAIGVFTAINTFINVVTFEFSIEDILATVISGKVSSVVGKFIKNEKISKAVSDLIDKLLGDFLEKHI